MSTTKKLGILDYKMAEEKKKFDKKFDDEDCLREKLMKLNKNELIDMILELNNKKRSFINMNNNDNDLVLPPKKKQKQQKSIDVSKYDYKRIAIKLAYLGDKYDGLIIQNNNDNSIERHLFNGLIKCCLIKDIESSEFNRCGRTDKGVSSFGNVYSFIVRCNKDNNKPINYIKIINKLLPNDIKVLSYKFVNNEFNARFDCKGRIYKYIFFNDKMDINSMNKGCKLLIGKHDFRNFCKMDVVNVNNFIREIMDIKIEKVWDNGNIVDGLYCCTIIGTAFLWHQIRYIMSVLFMIGNRLENIDIIHKMLDVNNFGGKPFYNMASDVSLILYDCLFDENVLKFDDNQDELKDIIFEWHQMWRNTYIKSFKQQMYWNEISNICGVNINDTDIFQFNQTNILKERKNKKYIKMCDRQREPKYEERIKNLKNSKLVKYNQKQKQREMFRNNDLS